MEAPSNRLLADNDAVVVTDFDRTLEITFITQVYVMSFLNNNTVKKFHVRITVFRRFKLAPL